jgi:hypothetical protein
MTSRTAASVTSPSTDGAGGDVDLDDGHGGLATSVSITSLQWLQLIPGNE